MIMRQGSFAWNMASSSSVMTSTFFLKYFNILFREKEPSHTAGGNASYYNHYGKQYGGFLKN
jgi:hypothetical protein